MEETATLILGVGSGFGALSPGAIVGELASPYSANFLPTSGSYLTTGSLPVGDTGEFGSLTDFTVELWFQVLALPSSARFIIKGPEISAGVRQWELSLNTTGTVAFAVRNSVPTTFTITSTTALSVNSWYYVVGAVDSVGGLVRLFINATQEASTAWSSTVRVSSLSATAGDMRVGDAGSNVDQYYDALATYRRYIGTARISAHYQGGAQRGFARDKPGGRMISILDVCASVHAPRSLQLGVRNVVPRFMAAQPPLEELQLAHEAENVDSMLFVANDGTITFLAADHRSNAPYNTVQATYGDGGGSELPYLDFKLDYSDTFIANVWNATRSIGPAESSGSTGSTQTVSDSTSVGFYFTRPQNLSDLPVEADSNALDIATAMLAKYKDPMTRVTSLQPNMADPETALQTYRLDIGSRIRFLRTPPGGGARLDQEAFVQKIDFSGAPGQPPMCQLTVSPL